MKLPGDGSTARTAEDLTGATVGRYVISARLGAGNMGEVYLAQHTQLRHHVAIKRLAPKLRADARYLARFLREGQRASALNHPHIARVYDVLEEKGELLLVMEYVEGNTLRERLKEAMGTEEFLETAIQCGEALAVAHQKGILHGDIKPENIMLTPEHQVKVLDFGVARRLPLFDQN
ncbi:MAG TPA: serine/threonine-protein kinase, partial [Terriglobia bacterium]|nr:serine/threonine-protein kinase [Terriglobia bacterium]